MTATTKKMRENICIKNYIDVVGDRLDKGNKEGALSTAARPEVRLCLERSRLVTQAYKETDGEPMVMRRAKALEKILNNMTIYIDEGERIVGNFASNRTSVSWYPEFNYRWLDREINDQYGRLLNKEGKEELQEIHQYFEGKSIDDRLRNLLPDRVRPFVSYNGVTTWLQAHGQSVPNYDRLFSIGLEGVVAEARGRLDDLEHDPNIHAGDYVDQRDFLEAVIKAIESGIGFAGRYSLLAGEMSEKESDPERKRELIEISEICDRVPANSPRTFHEALQFFWFIHLINNLIEAPGNGLGVRFDQVLYPFYKSDRETGRITGEKARELLEFLWIKFEETGHLQPSVAIGILSGQGLSQTLNICGVTEDGEDATNELSYLILDVAKEMRTAQPTLALRYHDRIPRDLILQAIDLLRTGVGYPALFNDKAIIPHLLSKGISLKDARNYSIVGCVQWWIPGKNIRYRCTVGNLNLGKCLELALARGVDKFTGRQLGYPTSDPKTFSSIDEVMDAYLKQVEFFFDKLSNIDNVCEALYERYLPRPFASALIDGCIERGHDTSSWRHYSHRTSNVSGNTNVADSLACIRKLVFEEKRITMEQLLDALRDNFEGQEDLRLILIRESPKFGNDDDYVDLLAREVHCRTSDVISSFADYFGEPFGADGSGTSAYHMFSFKTGATPDGRKDGESLSDAVLSPMAGRDINGPTAVLKSTSKIDPVSSYEHLFNQKFLPQFLEGEHRKVFADYIRTWSDLGHYHIQFNVVDRDTLLDAQRNPEKHTNLVVRVAGYSAYFVDLSKGLQDDIIRRTEQTF